MQSPEKKIVIQTLAIIGVGFLLYLLTSSAFRKKDEKNKVN
jgi:hypothetical protein